MTTRPLRIALALLIGLCGDEAPETPPDPPGVLFWDRASAGPLFAEHGFGRTPRLYPLINGFRHLSDPAELDHRTSYAFEPRHFVGYERLLDWTGEPQEVALPADVPGDLISR